ncbi:hypothetical protein BASA81_001004 [Batrachochytrium salamandrivorans]|nr:hypothetical protein BASA81_001004 [Batrachochytrium salamandrivorans]
MSQAASSAAAAAQAGGETRTPFSALSNEVKKWLFTPIEHSEEREQLCRELEQLESKLFSKQGSAQCREEEGLLLQRELAKEQDEQKRESLQDRLTKVQVSDELLLEIAQVEEERNRMLNEYWQRYFSTEWPEALANSGSSALQRNIMMASPNVQLAAANMISLRGLQQQQQLQQQGKKRSIDLVNGNGGEDTQQQQQSEDTVAIKCNCKKSRCLKLYCECFAARRMCVGECKCADCANNAANGKKRDDAIRTVLDRRPDAFHTKVFVATGTTNPSVHLTAAAAATPSAAKIPSQTANSPNASTVAAAEQVALAHARGCTCRKTKCTKKYCVCFNTSVKCGDWCRCVGCENGKEEEAPTAAAAAAAAAAEKALILSASDRLFALADFTVAGEEESAAASIATSANATSASKTEPTANQ